MALAIAHEVSRQLTFEQAARLARGKTANPRAYEAYLRGRALFDQRAPEPTAAAVGYFEQALREDPNFALAYSGLADCYSTGWGTKNDRELAEKYARKALELAPDLAEAHASLGKIETDNAAEKELRRAIELDPNYAPAHHWSAVRLVLLGRLEEGLAENVRARQLDPFSLPFNHLAVNIFMGLHQYDRAIQQAKTEAVLSPGDYAHVKLYRIYWIQGRVQDAIAEEKILWNMRHVTSHFHDLDEVAATFAQSGLRAAQAKAAHLKARRFKDPYPALQIAWQYGVLQDKEKVLEWLERAIHDQDEEYGFAPATSPEFDCVRADPRFHVLLRRLGQEP